MAEPILRANELVVSFPAEGKRLFAACGVSLDIDPGETVALVGESGSGKTVTSLSLLNLVPPPGRIDSGEVIFEGRNLLKLNADQMRAVRGARMAMIFQEPMTSLNPVFTVGSQVVEAILAHESVSPRDAWQRALDLLKRVKIPEAAQRLRQYPHQLSGGMQQRVMIAMALACKPVLLIADEPTTALDVTVQAEILELLEGLKRDTGMSMLIITHDLGIVAETAERIYVMYAGRIVEKCSVTEILTHPMHPYTAGLLQAVPSLEGRSGKLRPIPGTVPNLAAVPSGCPFHPRCYLADSICERVEPPLRKAASDHWSACHFAESVKWPITDSSS